MPLQLSEIAERIGAVLSGADVPVSGVATLEDAGRGDVSVCFNQRSLAALRKTRASGVILPEGSHRLAEEAPCAALLCENPRLAMAKAIDLLHTLDEIEPGIIPGAIVDPEARVDPGARIEAGACLEAETEVGAGSVIENGVVLRSRARVGRDCRIGANAVINSGCTLGDRVRLGSCVVIGSTGFGYTIGQDGPLPIRQVGKVVIGDDVDIGANTTIDRATLGETRIGSGTKIDNLVQVGHNVIIGENVIIAAQVGLSGSVRIEDGAVLGGQVGVADHITIGAGAQIGAKSGVGGNVPPGARFAGYPAIEVKQWLKDVFDRRRIGKSRKGGKGRRE